MDRAMAMSPFIPGLSPAAPKIVKAAPMEPQPSINWWDLLPLVEDPNSTPSIHWTPQGIVTAHPTRPLLLLYPQPPTTAARRTFPLDRRISDMDAYGPARVLSVSGSGEFVFAYFPSSNGSTSGAWCIWENMVLRGVWPVDQGERIIACWWLGNPREWVTDATGRSIRLPMLGPRVAGHGPMALILSENFTLRLLCLPVAMTRPENAFHILVVNALRKTLNSSRATGAAMDPYTGHLCTHAALGLSYSDSSIVLAMKASLLPPPCLPTSESVSMGLGIPATTFLPHAKRDDWEYNGTESMIRLTEIKITFTDARGWDMSSIPLPSIPVSINDQLTHLMFVPRSPGSELADAMDIDQTQDPANTRFLVVGRLDFGTHISPPQSELTTYRISHRKTPGSLENEWISQLDSTRRIAGSVALALKTAAALHQQQTGILVSLPQVELQPGKEKFLNEVRMLQIPSLQDDERFRPLELPDAPISLAISPQSTHIALQSFSKPKVFGVHSYPQQNDVTSLIVARNGLAKAVLSSQDPEPVIDLMKTMDRASKLELLGLVWDLLDQEAGGGGPARWSIEYLRTLLLIDRQALSSSGSQNAEKEKCQKRVKASLDLLSIPTARSALYDCHNQDKDGPYETDAVWPLSQICSWVIEFSENVLAVANDHNSYVQMQSKEGNEPNVVEPILLVILHSSLLQSWIEALSLVNVFLKHVETPQGSNSDNKVLLTKEIEDVLEESPINIGPLLEALKTVGAETAVSYADWRRAYTSLTLPETLQKPLMAAISRLISSEIVSLLPLHIRMAGMNLFADEGSKPERDIISKKPLTAGEWQTAQTLGTGATCQRCGGKKKIELPNLSTQTGEKRWNRWEKSFDRCICGGRWNRPLN